MPPTPGGQRNAQWKAGNDDVLLHMDENIWMVGLFILFLLFVAQFFIPHFIGWLVGVVSLPA